MDCEAQLLDRGFCCSAVEGGAGFTGDRSCEIPEKTGTAATLIPQLAGRKKVADAKAEAARAEWEAARLQHRLATSTPSPTPTPTQELNPASPYMFARVANTAPTTVTNLQHLAEKIGQQRPEEEDAQQTAQKQESQESEGAAKGQVVQDRADALSSEL